MKIYYSGASPSYPKVDTGIDLIAGSTSLAFDGGVDVMYVPGMTVRWLSANGDPGCIADEGYLLPGANCWSLIARIGNGPPFQVFTTTLTRSYTPTTSGRLYLAINYKQTITGSGGWLIRIGRYQWDTPSPTPKPSPFLELPWNYAGKDLSFSDAALAINSYFDHEYPLLSSGLGEPEETSRLIMSYLGPPRSNDAYSSHDGYDYGTQAGAPLNTEVLAAATGCASYLWSNAGGNMIFIDHHNHYQTRYLHLMDDGLVTKSSTCVEINQNQPIGKIGFTGHVIPPGSGGAHIHFMVVEDKNRDGNFDDNIPDGVTDPFGWQSEAEDPWPKYSFEYGGSPRTGNTSFYLWQHQIPNLSPQLTANGGIFQLEKYKATFPQGATNQGLNLWLNTAPIVVISDLLHSIGPTLEIKAKDLFNEIFNNLQKPFQLTVDYSSYDLTRFKPETLQIYSSEDGTSWQPEITTVDSATKTASAQIQHFSFFTLVAERIDTVPPTTSLQLSGTGGTQGWYSSPVQVTLAALDNENGLGVDYSLYRINNGSWNIYENPLDFQVEGKYALEYYSLDKDENKEEIKTSNFQIDKTAPTTNYVLSGENGTNNTFPSDVTLTLTASDDATGSGVNQTLFRQNSNDWSDYTQTLTFTNEGSYNIEFYSIDLAGNLEIVQSVSFTIDKGPPEAQINYNPQTRSLLFTGIDTQETTVKIYPEGSKQKAVISDATGNRLTIYYKQWTFLGSKFYSFESISYNDQTPVAQEPNVLNIIHLYNANTTSYLNQIWLVKNEALLNILYQNKNNTSYITLKTPSSKWQKITKAGLTPLKLTTDKGKLIFSY